MDTYCLKINYSQLIYETMKDMIYKITIPMLGVVWEGDCAISVWETFSLVFGLSIKVDYFCCLPQSMLSTSWDTVTINIIYVKIYLLTDCLPFDLIRLSQLDLFVCLFKHYLLVKWDHWLDLESGVPISQSILGCICYDCTMNINIKCIDMIYCSCWDIIGESV